MRLFSILVLPCAVNKFDFTPELVYYYVNLRKGEKCYEHSLS